MLHSGLTWEEKLLISKHKSSPHHPTWNFRGKQRFYLSHFQLGIESALNVCCALAFSRLQGSLHFPQRKRIKIWHLSRLPLICCFSPCQETTKLLNIVLQVEGETSPPLSTSLTLWRSKLDDDDVAWTKVQSSHQSTVFWVFRVMNCVSLCSNLLTCKTKTSVTLLAIKLQIFRSHRRLFLPLNSSKSHTESTKWTDLNCIMRLE